MNTELLTSIRNDLRQLGDEATRANAQRFFKEPVLTWGVKSPAVDRTARKYRPEMKALGKEGAFALCEELLKTEYLEEATIAFEWVYDWRDRYEAADFDVFEDWIVRYVNNWAKCDVFCNHAVGAFIERYPAYIDRLKDWARRENRWLRRAAAVSLIIPARQGKFLAEAFQIADILLMDEDDLVRKGYGWLLKEASRKHPAEVFDYVMLHRPVMPRTAFRYAIEKMPPDLRRRAMAK